MESINIQVDAKAFDESVHGTEEIPSLPEAGDLAMYVKPGAMASGAAGVVITFTVELPDGSRRRAQAATSAKLLLASLRALEGLREAGLFT